MGVHRLNWWTTWGSERQRCLPRVPQLGIGRFEPRSIRLRDLWPNSHSVTLLSSPRDLETWECAPGCWMKSLSYQSYNSREFLLRSPACPCSFHQALPVLGCWIRGKEPLLAHAALFYEGQRGAPAFVGTPPWHLSGVKPMPPLLE